MISRQVTHYIPRTIQGE